MTEDLMRNIVIMIHRNEHTHKHLQEHNTPQMKLQMKDEQKEIIMIMTID